MAVKVGIIGLGNIGSAHAKTILAGDFMTLAATCDINPQRQIPGVPFFTDYHQLLKTDVEAVIIAVPHPLHSAIAIDAFQAGKHVLVEKPLDITVTRAKEIIAAAGDKVFGVMFNQRTGNLFQKARELVQGGLLGQLKRADWIITNWYRTQHYYDSGNWRATWAGEGGGVLINQAPHQLDLWQWICGMPEAIRAECAVGKYHQIEVEDSAIIFARFPGGATGTFTTTTGEFPGTNRLEIAGTLGKLVLEDGLLKWWKLEQDERQFCKDCPISNGKIPFTYQEFSHIPTQGHQLILEDFARSITEGTPLLAPGAEGLASLTIQNAAYLSAWSEGQWVALPFDEARFNQLLHQRQTPVSFTTTAIPSGEYEDRWQINW